MVAVGVEVTHGLGLGPGLGLWLGLDTFEG